MGQPYVGQVIAVGFNFVPAGWLACDGSTYPISEYDVLYNLIGTTYGGDGTRTFGVPDLRGRTPVDAGQGPGLSNYTLGQRGGAETVTLTAAQVGSHNHPLIASAQTGSISTPASNLAIAQVSEAQVKVFGVGPGNTTLSANAVGPSGSSQPHENRQPFLTVNYIICYAGIYPSQS
ncbi:MAG: tail fiber protein [Rhodopila sp.]|nr:tail fiber protein [Rhodopila sp.]